MLNTRWTDPQSNARPVRSILVVGISQDTSNRRVYEDAMVARLTADAGRAKVPAGFCAPAEGPDPPWFGLAVSGNASRARNQPQPFTAPAVSPVMI